MLREDLDTRVKANLRRDMEVKTMEYFSCVTSYDLGVFGPFFPKLP